MTKEEMRALKRGDLVRHKGDDGRSFLVDQNFGDRATLIRSADMTNPAEWERAGDEPVDPGRAQLLLSMLIDFGYLQEVNRLFFHRLGLALMVLCENDGTPIELRIWDCRDEPDGIIFAQSEVTEAMFVKANAIARELQERDAVRSAALGFTVQPLGLDEIIASLGEGK